LKGTIFDIQKFALHDGPGIRTVVFLKGCPLHCAWCCNPESIRLDPQLGFDQDKCIQCFRCIKSCPENALSQVNHHLKINFNSCTACGNCIPECPEDALKIYGYEMESEDIIHEVLKDKHYYDNSSGGLTLSGGDPLLQFDFALEILKLAKQNELNTCLETEGFGPQEKFEKIIPFVNHFLYDYKITDEEHHKKYTGVSNQTIISNLDFLCKNHHDIILRCIIIPGINDHEEHFQALVDFEKKYSSIQSIEILPYHDYGRKKYQMIGRQYPLAGLKTVSKEQAKQWLKQIQKLGSKKIKMG